MLHYFYRLQLWVESSLKHHCENFLHSQLKWLINIISVNLSIIQTIFFNCVSKIYTIWFQPITTEITDIKQNSKLCLTKATISWQCQIIPVAGDKNTANKNDTVINLSLEIKETGLSHSKDLQWHFCAVILHAKL